VVGYTSEDHRHGGSLRVWRDFLPNAFNVAADTLLTDEPRITTYVLAAIRLTQFDPGDLGDGIPFVGGLERLFLSPIQLRRCLRRSLTVLAEVETAEAVTKAVERLEKAPSPQTPGQYNHNSLKCITAI
jgi:hypothetical protein